MGDMLKIAGKSIDGLAKALSVEIDDNNNGVLRIVDAAPHGYDEESDALKIVIVGNIIVDSGVWTLADKVEMRTTAYKEFDLQFASGLTPNEIRRFKRFKISIHDTHDKNAKVEIFSSTVATGREGSNASGLIYKGETDIVSGDSDLLYSSKALLLDGINQRYNTIPNLDDLHSNIIVRVTFAEPPTVGTITIMVEAQI